MSVDKRGSRRAPLTMLVQRRSNDMDAFMREVAANLSAGGVFLRTHEPRPVGAMLYLQFTLADGGKLIEGLGRVVHVNPPDHPCAGMGIEFVNMDAASQALIERIVDARLAELGDVE